MPLILSSSALKDIYLHQEVRPEWCPKAWEARYIHGLKPFPGQISESMQYGSYGEYLCGVNPWSEVKDIVIGPKGGGQTTKDRIFQQSLKWKDMVERHGIIVKHDPIEESTVQRRIVCAWRPEGYKCPKCKSDNITEEEMPVGSSVRWLGHCNNCGYYASLTEMANVVLQGTIDILTPYPVFDARDQVVNRIPLGNLDTKFCGNLNSDFGEHQWKNPAYRDHIQMDLYSLIFHEMFGVWLPGAYYVMDWSKDINSKWVYHDITEEGIRIVKETIRKAIFLVVQSYREGFKTNPTYNKCKMCPLLKTCPDAATAQNTSTKR